MPNHDENDQQLFASLRTYGAVLDRAAEDASPSNAPVADLVALPPTNPRRYLLAAAAVAVVVAAGAGVVLARDADSHPKVRTPSTTVPSATVTTTERTTPVPPHTVTRDFLVATSDGVVRVDAAGKQHRVVDGATAIAVPDTNGGIVFQRVDGDTTLWHLAVGTTEPTPIVTSAARERLHLFDVATIRKRVVAVYTLQSAPSGQDNPISGGSVATLRVVDLATRATRALATVGGWEFGPGSISAGGDRFALEACGEAACRFEFRDADGTVVKVPGNAYDDPARFPAGFCPDDPTCPRSVAISADGTRYAYIELVGKPSSDPRFIPIDYRVVVLNATTGAEIGAVPVQFPRGGKQDLHVNDLDLDGDTVVVNWSTWDGHKLAPQKPLVANLQHETVTTIPLAGNAHT